jgi:hypothetical protein
MEMGTDAEIAFSNRYVEPSHGKAFLPGSSLFFPRAQNNQS